MSAILVLDVGKTNVKLSAAAPDGRLIETLSMPNPVRPGPPYPHHDLDGIEAWLQGGMRALGGRHAVEAVVACGHGSGGVLVGGEDALLPMVDYEQPASPSLDAAYRAAVGPFRERGSGVMLGLSHLARQMLFLERGWPDAFARARAFLALPQYWAWRLSGVMASEVTSLAAQSHLWSALDGRPARIVAERGWGRLLPPLRPAWTALGPLRPEVAARTGLPARVRVLNGIHDSSANLYRYQAAGLDGVTVVSTGTWIVALSDRTDPGFAEERAALCCNADVRGRPLTGVLAMGGRAFAAVAGDAAGPASRAALDRIVGGGTMALPSFGPDDGLFPGTRGQGRIEGPDDPALRYTLAVLHVALLTDRCLDAVATGTVVLDGPFTREPLYGALLAALRPERRVLVERDGAGAAAGAALLFGHEGRTAPIRLDLDRPDPIDRSALGAYAAAWRTRADKGKHG